LFLENDFDDPTILLSTQLLPFEPKTTPGIDGEKCTPGYERTYIWVPEDHPVKLHAKEELMKIPLIM